MPKKNRKKAASIVQGLKDALAYEAGETSKGVVTAYEVFRHKHLSYVRKLSSSSATHPNGGKP